MAVKSTKHTAEQLVDAILNHKSLFGIPHSELDCQAAVEKALERVGVRVNYRGSNHMWREMVEDRHLVDDWEEEYGEVPQGLILFHVTRDGKEKERGYNDDAGNAVHVGIMLRDGLCFHSGAKGTEMIPLAKSTFNYAAKCKYIDYGNTTYNTLDDIITQLDNTDDFEAALYYLDIALGILKRHFRKDDNNG